MFGAELSEVWRDYKPKKKKKKDKPLTPEDMDSGLLLEKREKTMMDERERISSLVDDRETDYRYERVNPNVVTFKNPYGSRFEMKGREEQKKIPKPMTLEDDPDYKEFLEFKRNKGNKGNRNSFRRNIISNEPLNKRYDNKDNEQLNELILYIFTGFFLLILYDNIYRLGKKSY